MVSNAFMNRLFFCLFLFFLEYMTRSNVSQADVVVFFFVVEELMSSEYTWILGLNNLIY